MKEAPKSWISYDAPRLWWNVVKEWLRVLIINPVLDVLRMSNQIRVELLLLEPEAL
jgi:hypothetical protein